MKKVIRAILFSLGIVFVFALALRFGYEYASASEQVDQEQLSSGAPLTGNLYYGFGQTFIPSSTNITKIVIGGSSNMTSATSTFELYDTSIPAVIYSDSNIHFTINGETSISLATTSLVVGRSYFLRFYTNNQSLFIASPLSGVGSDLYSRGDAYFLPISSHTWTIYSSLGGSVLIDLFFKTFYDNNVLVNNPIPDPIVGVLDTELMDLDYASLVFNPDYFCFASTTLTGSDACYVDYRFNDYAVGSQVWIYSSDSLVDGVPTGSVLSSSTIPDNNFNIATSSIPYTPELYGKKKQYCAFLYCSSPINSLPS